MAVSYAALCDDFYVNMTLNTELELPSERDTILHFCERIQRQFPSMNSFYQRDTGDFCLDEDRESGSYRWVTVEKDRICCGHINPASLEEADELHKLVLDLVSFAVIKIEDRIVVQADNERIRAFSAAIVVVAGATGQHVVALAAI